MVKLLLSEDGVFPILWDENGELLKDLPETGINIPGTIQGEGKLVGMPSIFVRLAGCNLRCEWTLPDGTKSRCDTPYASFETVNAKQKSIEEVADIVRNNLKEINHVVITGGEPFLQSEALAALCSNLKSDGNLHITVETNGTLFCEDVARHVDLFSVSPKLSYTLGGNDIQELESEVQKFLDFVNISENKDIQLKFVASSEGNEKAINNFLSKLTNWQSSDVLIMPAGETESMLDITSPIALTMSIRNGWRFCSRLHVNIFGNKRGV